MEWIYGLSHIVERRGSEQNPNDSAQAGGREQPQEKSIQDHGHIFPVLYYLYFPLMDMEERMIQCRDFRYLQDDKFGDDQGTFVFQLLTTYLCSIDQAYNAF